MDRETRAARGASLLVATWLGAAVLALPAHVAAQEPAARAPYRGFDVSPSAPSFGPAISGGDLVRQLSPADALPVPRTLRGYGRSSEDAALDLNLGGYSRFGLNQAEGERFKFRGIREREWRDPGLSVTIQKRF